MILDADVVGKVFGSTPDSVALEFRKWMEDRRCRIVVGGRLETELGRHRKFLDWARRALLDGRLRRVSEAELNAATDASRGRAAILSNDAHVIALARASGARILYSRDQDLRNDFKNRRLLDGDARLLPLGESKTATRRRRELLRREDLCRTRRR